MAKIMIAKNKHGISLLKQHSCDSGRPHSVYLDLNFTVFASVNWHIKVKSLV